MQTRFEHVIRHRVTTGTIIVSLVALKVFQGYPSLWGPLLTPDEALLLVYPDRVRAGALPNRDFLTVSGALVNYAYASVYSIFGTSYLVERLVGLLYHCAIVISIYRIARETSSRAIALLSALFSMVILQGLGLGAFAYLGGVALLTSSMAVRLRDTSRSILLSGILSGLAIGWRYELLLPALLSATPMTRNRRSLITFSVGLGLGATPTMVHLTLAGRYVFKTIVQRAQLDFQVAPELVSNFVQIGLWACVITPVFIGLLAWERKEWTLASQAGLCAGLLPQLLQRIDAIHLAYVGCVILPVLINGAMLVITPYLDKYSSPIIYLAVALLSIGSTAQTIAHWQNPPSRNLLVTHAGRDLPVSSADFARSLTNVLAAVERVSKPQDSVFSGAIDMSRPTANFMPIYILLHQHDLNAYYLELLPGVAEQKGSGLKRDIMRSNVLVLTEMDSSESSLLYPNLRPGDSEVNEVVRNHFRTVGQYGIFHVYVHRHG